MTEHKYANYLRAIADGKTVQVRDDGEWIPITVFNAALVQLISGNDTGWQFRIAPETISITLQNGEVRTINAPLRVIPEDGDEVWYVGSGTVYRKYFNKQFARSEYGYLFATESDARAWADLQREILGALS